MTGKNIKERLDYDEESIKDKAKKGVGIFALIGSGLLSILHTMSHVVPAIGVLGLSLGQEYPRFYSFVSNEYVQLAYIPFVALSFYYMHRDHKHHKHERELRKKLYDAKKEIRLLKQKK